MTYGEEQTSIIYSEPASACIQVGGGRGCLASWGLRPRPPLEHVPGGMASTSGGASLRPSVNCSLVSPSLPDLAPAPVFPFQVVALARAGSGGQGGGGLPHVRLLDSPSALWWKLGLKVYLYSTESERKKQNYPKILVPWRNFFNCRHFRYMKKIDTVIQETPFRLRTELLQMKL